jgi:hypothetical protein
MRINDVNTSSKITSVKKKKGASGSTSASSVFSLDSTSTESAHDQIQETHNISNIQSVLSIDSIGILSQAANEEFIKHQNIIWGKDVLKQLEIIKYQILNGKVSYSSLLSLKERLNNIPINPNDHKLREIIEQIQIRAEVEIEKLAKVTDNIEFFINKA